jgi:hypothetical protein
MCNVLVACEEAQVYDCSFLSSTNYWDSTKPNQDEKGFSQLLESITFHKCWLKINHLDQTTIEWKHTMVDKKRQLKVHMKVQI